MACSSPQPWDTTHQMESENFGRLRDGYGLPSVRDPSSLSTHGDIGVDPYSTDAHTAMILRARGFGVSIDIFNLYNHYPRTSL